MQKFVDCLNNAGNYLTNREFLLGMAFAAIILVVLYLVVKGLRALHRRCDCIQVKENGGEFVIMRSAFRDFLKGTIDTLSGVKLKCVALTKHADKVIVDLYVSVVPGADVIYLRNSLRNDILVEVKNKLGIAQQIEEINVKISAMPPSGKLSANPEAEKEPLETPATATETENDENVNNA